MYNTSKNNKAKADRTFLFEHHREHLHKSGLTDETIQHAGIYSLDDPIEAGKILNWNDYGPVPCLAFPYHDIDGNTITTVLRPDKPHLRKDGSAPKYEGAIGNTPRPYFVPNTLVPKKRYLNCDEPLIITEGIKKALSVAQLKATPISLQGITVGHDIEFKKRTSLRQLHPDIAQIPLANRKVYIAFDGGDTSHNPHVIVAEAWLARMLIEQNANVFLMRIPSSNGEKAGLDDYLVDHMDRKFLEALYNNAILADPIARIKEILHD